MPMSISIGSITPVVIADNPSNPRAAFTPTGYQRDLVETLTPTVDYSIRATKIIKAAATSKVPVLFELSLLVTEGDADLLEMMFKEQQHLLYTPPKTGYEITIGDGIRKFIERSPATRTVYSGSTVTTGNYVSYFANFATVWTRFKVIPPATGRWFQVDIQAVS